MMTSFQLHVTFCERSKKMLLITDSGGTKRSIRTQGYNILTYNFH